MDRPASHAPVVEVFRTAAWVTGRTDGTPRLHSVHAIRRAWSIQSICRAGSQGSRMAYVRGRLPPQSECLCAESADECIAAGAYGRPIGAPTSEFVRDRAAGRVAAVAS